MRQLFMLAAGLAALVLMLWGAASGLQVLLRLLVDVFAATIGDVATGSRWWQNSLASSFTQLLVGAWLAHA
ncbi:hypothetical protein, partial [Salmonella sp. SAL4359]|uniref:hypothetical protein n=1 Tax=Salmonella sp. SAL4359 TaxID=3159880 RepID=UPI00397B5CC4